MLELEGNSNYFIHKTGECKFNTIIELIRLAKYSQALYNSS